MMIQTIPRNLKPWMGATDVLFSFVLKIVFVFEYIEKQSRILPMAPGFRFLFTTAASKLSLSLILSGGKQNFLPLKMCNNNC